MSDGFEQLEAEHREIEAQIQAFLRDDEAPVVREMAERLTRHSQLEERWVYPALRRLVDGGDDLAERAQQEHATIATMVAELYDSAIPERVDELVTQLRSAVMAHVEFEESQVFPQMRSCGVDAAELARDLASTATTR